MDSSQWRDERSESGFHGIPIYAISKDSWKLNLQQKSSPRRDGLGQMALLTRNMVLKGFPETDSTMMMLLEFFPELSETSATSIARVTSMDSSESSSSWNSRKLSPNKNAARILPKGGMGGPNLTVKTNWKSKCPHFEQQLNSIP